MISPTYFAAARAWRVVQLAPGSSWNVHSMLALDASSTDTNLMSRSRTSSHNHKPGPPAGVGRRPNVSEGNRGA